MRSDAIKPGDVVAGKFRVRAILSRTRGFLVEAFHTEFDQRVVIRILSPALCDEKEVERFRREARTLAKLESEHVARILDVGTERDGTFYFVRQYLEGTDLGSHLKKRGSLPLQEAVLLVLQASEAVAESHVHNIILRELQPSHLFLTQRLGGEPLVKIVDFGTAKLMRDAAAPGAGGELTATAMFGLSPYSSPELVRKAKNVDGRTDVWSLGAILYQLLTGRPPFEGEMAALMLQITREDVVPASRVRQGIPPEIDAILGWAMAKDVDGRFASVHAFAHALTPFAPAEGQVLIQRIGAITTAAKQRRREPVPSLGARDVDPDLIDSNDLLEDDGEEKPTRMLQSTEYLAPSNLPPGAKPAADSPFDRTMFMGADYAAAPPSSVPAARGSRPTFAGAAADLGGRQPQQQSLLGPPLELAPGAGAFSRSNAPASGFAAAGQGGFGATPTSYPQAGGFTQPVGDRSSLPPGGGPGGQSAGSTGGYQAIEGSAPKRGMQKIALAAVAATVVGISIFAGVFLFRSHPNGGDASASEDTVASATPAAPGSAVAAAAAAAAADSAALAAAASASVPAVASAATSPSADPAASAAVAAPSAKTASSGAAAASGPASAGKHTAQTAVVAPPPPPPPTATPAAAGGDSMGTLVAVAVGGSCAFSVNGASKGTMSTLKMQLKAGTYSVTCKPESGASKSRSVTIAGGGTAMAMFKL